MLAVLLSLALAAPAHLRLADLLREARDKNPDLAAATARLRAARSAISPAGALDDPMLMVQLWNAPADFSTIPVMVQLAQNIPLGGTAQLQVRAEIFNAFNTVNYGNPGSTFGAASFGRISSAGSMRQVQLGARLSF